MDILRKTFGADTSGIEVHTNDGDVYPFRLESDSGEDIAVYVGRKRLPPEVETAIKDQGYASAVQYEVDGVIEQYVETASGGSGGTAGQVELPNFDPSAEPPETLTFVDGEGTAKAHGLGFPDGQAIDIASGIPTVEAHGRLGVRSSAANADGNVPKSQMSAREGSGETSQNASVYVHPSEIVFTGGPSPVPVRMQGAIMEYQTVDVSNVPNPEQGMVVYADGTNGTEGPAFYDGTDWISMVDGTTVLSGAQ